MNNRRMAGLMWLGSILVLGQLAWGQGNNPPVKPEARARAIETQRKQLQLDKQRSELRFHNELQNIELEKKRLGLERERRALKRPDPKTMHGKESWRGRHGGRHAGWKHCAGLMVLCGIVHILLTVWVYGDIRQRKTGSGLWIVLTLLTGLLGAAVYALVRLGDKPAA